MKTIAKTMITGMMMCVVCLNALAAGLNKPVPENCDIEDGRQFYIYNVTAEQFVNADGITLTFNNDGNPILFEYDDSNDEWKMQGVKGYLYADWENVGCEGNSNDPNTVWCVERQSSGAYYIRPSKSDPDYLWENNPDTWTGISTETGLLHPILKSGEGYIDWFIVSLEKYELFVSQRVLFNAIAELESYGVDVATYVDSYNSASLKDEYDAAYNNLLGVLKENRIKNASELNPVDVTSLYLRNADLTENWVNDGHDVPGWEMTPSSFLGMGEFDNDGFYEDNKTLGSWSPGAFSDSRFYQKLTELNNGKYRFSNYGLWIRHLGEDGDPLKGAYIYAKIGDKVFKEPLVDSGWYRGYSEVVFECRTGEAEVGVMFENTNVGQCIILDFKLEYMGDQSVDERLKGLIEKSQSLIDEGNIGKDVAEQLKIDINLAKELSADADNDEKESLYNQFQRHYDEALENQQDYAALEEFYAKADNIMDKGDSDAINALGDYLLENDVQDKMVDRLFTKDEIKDVLKTLAELNTKAENSVIDSGMDVTYLLKNGGFTEQGGWNATLGDYSINTDSHILEKWWGDWSAEQTLTDIPNGTYRLEVQGFQFCHWDWAGANDDWNAGDGTPTYKVSSKLRLNDSETLIHNVFACGLTDIEEGYHGSSYYVPDNASVAMKFFELGLYDNKVETNVTDNTLKVVFDCSSSGFWNCFYNVRLTYIGADVKGAIENLKTNMSIADEYMARKMDGETLKAMQEANEIAQELLDNKSKDFNKINEASTNIAANFATAEESARAYETLLVALERACDVLKDEDASASDAGMKLRTLYETVNADYQSEYPSMTLNDAYATAEEVERLIAKAWVEGGVEQDTDITRFLVNPSFEILNGQDLFVSSGAHTVPYGWHMNVAGTECKTAEEIANAGINSFTAIEKNNYTTDGEYSYCLLSAPMPETYLYQTIKGLPAGTYKVSADMNVTNEGGASHLTGQCLLVNGNAAYYGKAENYNETELSLLHPDETSRVFAGYDEVNSSTTGESGDMGNMSTIEVEVTIAEGEDLVIGVRTDNNKSAMYCNYEGLSWDCCGRLKVDNFRLYCNSTVPTAINAISTNTVDDTPAYNLMGIRVNPATVRGIYIHNGKKYMK